MLTDQTLYVVQDKASGKFWPGNLEYGPRSWYCFEIDPNVRAKKWAEPGKGEFIFFWDEKKKIYRSIRQYLTYYIEEMERKYAGQTGSYPQSCSAPPSDGELWTEVIDSLEILELTLTHSIPKIIDFRSECAPKRISRLRR